MKRGTKYKPSWERNNVCGQRMLHALMESGWTKTALADKLGVSQSAVSYWTTGRGTPSVELLAKISEILGVSADYLLGLTEVEARAYKQDDASREIKRLLTEVVKLRARLYSIGLLAESGDE